MATQNQKFPDNPQIQVIKSGKTGLFTNYIFKAIPLAFDESLSYYECLCGLLNYLKNVIIPTVNNNADAVAELQTLYEELRSYVENYFDNLDVQEEINNKLDSMVESGELQEIISAYLNSKAVFGYDNVEDMKDATNLIDGSYARTLGYYEKNDGGSALYKITETLPENTHYETLDSGLYAILILENDVINPLQFGAVADGTTDNATLLNSLLTKYNKLNITGDFKINTSLTLNDNAILIGDNKHHIILPDDSSVCVNIDGNNVLVKDLKIKTTTTTYDNNTRCIRITSGLNCVIENCELYNAYNGIKVDPTNNDTIANLKIHNNNIHTVKAGIYFGNADETISFTISNIYITNNNIHDGVGVVDPSSLNNGIKLSRLTKQVVIDNNIIHNMKADGIDGFKSGDTLQITNNQIYNNGESAIELKDSTSYDDTVWGRAKNCVISNNIFYGHPSVDVMLNGTPYVVTTEEYKQYQNVIIKNNIFKTGLVAIRIATSNVSVCNNIINLYDYAVQLYDAYNIDTTYNNININENIINDAGIRVTGTNYYAHIFNNIMKFTSDGKSPVWNASSHVIIGDNSIVSSQMPYVNSSARISRETDRFIMIPFKFENITEQTLQKTLAIPKSNRKIQIIGGYIITNSDVAENNLSANVKFNDTTNELATQSNPSFTSGVKHILRTMSTYSAEIDVDTYVNIYSSVDVSGYMVLYYAYA